jgi:hypothetical protein
MENHYFLWEIHYKWTFSIAMLVYQRVTKGIPEKVNGDLWRSAENDPK